MVRTARCCLRRSMTLTSGARARAPRARRATACGSASSGSSDSASAFSSIDQPMRARRTFMRRIVILSRALRGRMSEFAVDVGREPGEPVAVVGHVQRDVDRVGAVRGGRRRDRGVVRAPGASAAGRSRSRSGAGSRPKRRPATRTSIGCATAVANAASSVAAACDSVWPPRSRPAALAPGGITGLLRGRRPPAAAAATSDGGEQRAHGARVAAPASRAFRPRDALQRAVRPGTRRAAARSSSRAARPVSTPRWPPGAVSSATAAFGTQVGDVVAGGDRRDPVAAAGDRQHRDRRRRRGRSCGRSSASRPSARSLVRKKRW